MKRIILLPGFIVCSLFLHAQVFPGISAANKKKLLATRYSIPLPTYIPAGFKLDTIILANLTKSARNDEKTLMVRYEKKINDSTYQSFHIDAGFDGLGSLWFKGETVNSAVGKIYMYYQPLEEAEEGQKPERVMDLIGTEWFTVKGTEFHVFCMVSEDYPPGEGDEVEYYRYTPVSKAEFKKILASLKILK